MGVFGQFRVEYKNDQQWGALASRKLHRRRARALLGCLLSNPGRRMGREQVIDALWPDLDIDVAINRLNGAVHELRLLLEPEIARPATSRMLRLEHDILELADNQFIWVDADAFERLLKEAHHSTDPAQTERLLEQAEGLYGGDYLLEELYSTWAETRRDALRREWRGLLLNMSDLRAARGAYLSAIDPLNRLLATDPINEASIARLMFLYVQLDRPREALRIYDQLVMRLEEYDGSEPLPETRKLYESVRLGQIRVTSTPRDQIAPVQTDVPNKVEATIEVESSTPAPSESLDQPQPATVTHPVSRQFGRSNQSPLIGRERELETLQQTLLSITTSPGSHPTSMQDRKPHFLLLMGEAGIGKTRLAEELSQLAYEENWLVAWSHSYEQEGMIPYRPWIELMRTLLQDFPIPPLTHEQERLHLWEATSAILNALSKKAPLLLVLDDLHWADAGSIELLAYLTRHLQNQRVLLVGTCRVEDLTPTHALRSLITDLRREQIIVTLSVQPLTESQIGFLVAHLPQAVIENIQARAAGNPFFAEELARTSERNDPPHSVLPEAICAVLERRINKLSSDCQALLSKATILGGSFELNQLLSLINDQSTLHEQKDVENPIFDLLEEALHAGILTEEGTGTHIIYHFWHPLIVSQLYGRLSEARRAQLHRRATSILVKTYQGHLD